MALMSKGAEADLYLEEYEISPGNKMKVVVKFRKEKKYRVKQLDRKIRSTRTRKESKLMHSARENGVPVPWILEVDPENFYIVMEYVDGKRLREIMLSKELSKENVNELFREIGRIVGKLHSSGIVHGDLTTGNMILSEDGELYLIDFGLGEFSKRAEDFAVDIYVLKRTLESTHYEYKETLKYFLEGYSQTFEKVREVLEKLKDVERRGRYVAR